MSILSSQQLIQTILIKGYSAKEASGINDQGEILFYSGRWLVRFLLLQVEETIL